MWHCSNDHQRPSGTIASITGTGGATLRGIDFRPKTGDLYGVGSDNIVYRVNPTTGIAIVLWLPFFRESLIWATLFYGIYLLCGGQSDTFFSPFFEFSRKDANILAALFVFYCILYLILCSIGLLHGIRSVCPSFIGLIDFNN